MRWLAPLTLVAAVGAVALYFATRPGGDPARHAFVGYAAAWSRGDDRAAARLTDNPNTALAQLEASRKGLDGASVKATVDDVSEKDDAAGATLAVAWEIPGIGRWSYRARLSAVKGEKGWVVRWRPTAIHPRLDAATRLGTAVKAPARGRIDDRQGRALMAERAVTAIDVDTRRVTDPAATAGRLADLIDEIDEEALRKQIEGAPKGGFVPVITLRKAAYDK